MVKESIGGNFYLFFAGKSCRREIIEWWYTYKKVIETVLFFFFFLQKKKWEKAIQLSETSYTFLLV
jgi:hypothetical protein